MRIHDVFHVNLLRPFRRRGGEKGAPPALMPSGETQYEVQEILSHLDDTDNERCTKRLRRLLLKQYLI
jgi:hypothetical protein